MMQRTGTIGLGAVLAALTWSTAAYASPDSADQVEFAEAEEGEIELEVRTLFVPEEEGGNGGLTVEYGLSDTTVIGVEAELEREDGALVADEVSFQILQVLTNPEADPVGLAVQLSAGYAFEDRALASRAVVIADVVRPQWRAAANLIAASREEDRGRFDLSYAARIDWQLPDEFTAGLEWGGGLAAGDPVGHWLGPVLAVPLAVPLARQDEAPRLELSAFAGLTRATPDWQFRVELDWPL